MKIFLFTILIIPAILTQAQMPSLIKDIVPGPGHPFIEGLSVAGNQVFFVAYDEAGLNSEVWRTNGTEEGTYMVKDINPDNHAVGYFPGFYVVNDIVFFIANDGVHGNELWKSDGTEAGTQLVKDIDPGSGGALDGGALAAYYDPCFTVLDDILYFSADDDVHGYELWRTDGTEAGTYMIKDLVPGYGNSQMEYITAAGDHVYFKAYNSDYENCVWITDGTEGGTTVLKENLWVYNNDYPDTHFFIEYHDYVYFAAGPDNYDIELWRTDGTEAGTQLFFEFDDDEFAGGDPSGLNVFNDKLIFWTSGFENKFYVSDGTVTGTNVLIDNEGDEVTVSDFATFLLTENKIYFPSAVGSYAGLWVTNLTTEGTYPLAQQDFNYITAGGNAYHAATAIGDDIVFNSYDEDNVCSALFQSNGTPEGTESSISCSVIHSPTNMITLNGKVIMRAEDADFEYGYELWLYEPSFAPVSISNPRLGLLSIYPNPTVDYIIIEREGFSVTEQMIITNVFGEIVYTATLLSGTQTINISDLASGIYFIKINNSIAKFIKE